MDDLEIRNGNIVIPGEGVFSGTIRIKDGKISEIAGPDEASKAYESIDVKGLYVLPGTIDPHTHWGNFGDFEGDCRQESKNAALGGTTTALLFQKVKAESHAFPEYSSASLPFEIQREIGDRTSYIYYGFNPIVHDEVTAEEIRHLAEKCGSPAVKFYLAYRNIPGAQEGSCWNEIDDGILLDAFHALSERNPAMACIHAENDEILNRVLEAFPKKDDDGLCEWATANPDIAEIEAVSRVGVFARSADLSLYIVHLSGRGALGALEELQEKYQKAYGETCTHYLLHNCDTSPKTVKFSPPVRSTADQEALWAGLATGSISCVGTDTICTPVDRKQGSVWSNGRGAPSAGILTSAILSEGYLKGRLSLERCVQVLSENAAKLFGMYPRKGTIKVGSDADLVIMDMHNPWRVGDVFPEYNDYADFVFSARPVTTILGGKIIAQDQKIISEKPSGHYLFRADGRDQKP